MNIFENFCSAIFTTIIFASMCKTEPRYNFTNRKKRNFTQSMKRNTYPLDIKKKSY